MIGGSRRIRVSRSQEKVCPKNSRQVFREEGFRVLFTLTLRVVVLTEMNGTTAQPEPGRG